MGKRAGFTLIELMIAITLVSAIVAGMLAAMRGGLLTLERVGTRIEKSRGDLGLDQMIRRQIGGVIPVLGDCRIDATQAVRAPLFRGNTAAMFFVTSYSMTEGARGYPRLVEYRVLPNNDGTARLVVDEMLYSSPSASMNFCSPPALLRPLQPARSMVLAPRLAAARILYREVNPATRLGGEWLPEWIAPNLPYAIRIDLQTAGAGGGPSSITVPFHLNRDSREAYADSR